MATSPQPQTQALPAAAGGMLPNPPIRPISSAPTHPAMPGFLQPAPAPTMAGFMQPPQQVPGSAPRYAVAPQFQMYAPRHTVMQNPPRPMVAVRPQTVPQPGIEFYAAMTFEKPTYKVYVGKIAPTVEDTFLKNVLQLCGPVKSWKRAQDTNAPKGFGFCEFETPEGILRALRLLNKFNLDGQELLVNVNKETRESLERYVARKENEKILEEVMKQEDTETAPGVEDPSEQPLNKDNIKDEKSFGMVSEADKKGDEEAMARLKNLLEERVKCRPIFRPLILESRSPSTREPSVRSRDEETNGRNEHEGSMERMETSSSRRDRGDHRENDGYMERYEHREFHRNNNGRRGGKDQKHKNRDAERIYEELVSDWEAREKEKERQRLHDKEREKERERERRKEVKDQEEDIEDETKKRRLRPEERDRFERERRRRRQREREDDLLDAQREEEEFREAKRRKIEIEQLEEERRASLKVEPAINVKAEPGVTVKMETDESQYPQAATVKLEDFKVKMEPESEAEATPAANGDSMTGANKSPETKPAVPKKLGFGLTGTGKRATVLAVFNQEDEEELPKDRKRELVPIDYTAEEMQAVKSKKFLDPKQLIDSIPTTREALFKYPIDWSIYDKHKLHERLRPWISKKIIDFLGEEERSFVDFIVSHTCKHVSAEEMLDKLKTILDDEAEMFVLKMWRMLIFEIRRVETGLAAKPAS